MSEDLLYTYYQWEAIGDAIGDAMRHAHDMATEHPEEADPLCDLSEYVSRVLDAAFGDAAKLGTCRTCAHAHMTTDGRHCKWCSVMATHQIDSDECVDPPNGYDPEPYFDADFFCGNYERVVDGE